MKTLTLLQPWATLVALEAKRIETRSWFTSYRGPLAIHAAKRMPKAAISLCWQAPFRTALEAGGYSAGDCPATNPFGLPLGAVIAVVVLIDVQHITLEYRPAQPEYSFGDYTPGRFAWILRDVHRLPEPVQAKGRLGLWEWTPSDLPVMPVLAVLPDPRSPVQSSPPRPHSQHSPATNPAVIGNL
jgi:hypothetical protein